MSSPLTLTSPTNFDCRACSQFPQYAGFCHGLPDFAMTNVICAVSVTGVANFVPVYTKAVTSFAGGQVSPVRYWQDNAGAKLPVRALVWGGVLCGLSVIAIKGV